MHSQADGHAAGSSGARSSARTVGGYRPIEGGWLRGEGRLVQCGELETVVEAGAGARTDSVGRYGWTMRIISSWRD